MIEIDIVAKRWFQKTYGNTYHVVRIYIDDKILTSRKTYGYGDQWQQTAFDLLQENGYLKDISNELGLFHSNYRSKNIDLRYRCLDVEREKDLIYP